MYTPSSEHLSALQEAAPNAAFVVASDRASAQQHIQNADVVLGNRHFLQSLPHARNLRWMQSNSAGVDLILRGAGQRLDGVTLTCAKGVYADEVADHTLALLLGITRGLPSALRDYQERQWRRWSLRTLRGSRALILGYGATGQAIATRLKSFGVTVEGVRRSHVGDPEIDALGVRVYAYDAWRHVLAATDLLIVAAPLTDETHHLVSAHELDELPDDAIVINVGRGEILDEAALFTRLRQGRLYGAGIDTLTCEPASPQHAVWDVPNLLLTPHVARSLETAEYRWQALFVENLKRYVTGQTLLNIVDQKAGY